ncbi:AMP-binding protein [Neobacillus sp. C211]|uniref:AMP-binding protein n=1 Tax=unclassified Neobacillus TaxID=2675272 RepID=UPI00397D12A6
MAAAKIGAVAVPVNFRLTASEIHYILDQSDTSLIVCDKEFEQIITTAKQGTETRLVITVGDLETTGSHSYERFYPII